MSMVHQAWRHADRPPGTSVRWVAAGDPSPRRFRRGVELAWSPVDAVLAARDLSNMAVVAVTIARPKIDGNFNKSSLVVDVVNAAEDISKILRYDGVRGRVIRGDRDPIPWGGAR